MDSNEHARKRRLAALGKVSCKDLEEVCRHKAVTSIHDPSQGYERSLHSCAVMLGRQHVKTSHTCNTDGHC